MERDLCSRGRIGKVDVEIRDRRNGTTFCQCDVQFIVHWPNHVMFPDENSVPLVFGGAGTNEIDYEEGIILTVLDGACALVLERDDLDINLDFVDNAGGKAADIALRISRDAIFGFRRRRVCGGGRVGSGAIAVASGGDFASRCWLLERLQLLQAGRFASLFWLRERWKLLQAGDFAARCCIRKRWQLLRSDRFAYRTGRKSFHADGPMCIGDGWRHVETAGGGRGMTETD